MIFRNVFCEIDVHRVLARNFYTCPRMEVGEVRGSEARVVDRVDETVLGMHLEIGALYYLACLYSGSRVRLGALAIGRGSAP